MSDVKFAIIVFIGVSISAISGVFLGIRYMEKQATKHECAIYAPTTGEFEWTVKDNK